MPWDVESKLTTFRPIPNTVKLVPIGRAIRLLHFFAILFRDLHLFNQTERRSTEKWSPEARNISASAHLTVRGCEANSFVGECSGSLAPADVELRT